MSLLRTRREGNLGSEELGGPSSQGLSSLLLSVRTYSLSHSCATYSAHTLLKLLHISTSTSFTRDKILCL